MNVLMVGVAKESKGGMYTVVENYLNSNELNKRINLKYIPIATVGSLSSRIFFSLKGILKFTLELKRGNYDIVHAHMSERGSVYRKGLILKIAKYFKVKTILHMHGADFEDWYYSLPNKRKETVKNIVNSADNVLILGEYWRDIFSKLIIRKDKIHVLYNAVPTYEINRYNINAKSILFLGALIKRKGVYDILRSIKNISGKLPKDITFDFYGPDVNGEFLKKTEELKLEDHVFYHGWLNSKDKDSVLSNTMFNLLPSYNEGLPMTILETMAFGIPNISTKVAAIPEAIIGNVNGIIIEPGDINELEKSILDLVNDEKKRMRFSKESFNKVETKFSIEEHIGELINIYNLLIKH